MARERNKLTARTVAALRTPGKYPDGGGLYISVDDAGRRRWLLRFKWRGAVRDMGLGSAADTSLAEAREKADAARKLIAAGINPVAERKRVEAEKEAEAKRQADEAASRKTFGEVADRVVSELRPSWRNAKHAAQWAHSLSVHAASLRAIPVEDIRTTDVLAALKPLWTRAPETASRLRGRIEHVIDAGMVNRDDDRRPNPARWRGHLDKLLPSPKKMQAGRRGHAKALPFDAVPGFIGELREREGVAPLALEFLVLTATRTSEVLNARWSEVDLAKSEWTIPAERMKANKTHRVPLSPRALAILTEVERLPRAKGCDAIFPNRKGDGPMSNMALAAVLKRMERNDITVHGFRSAFRDWAAERTNFPNEVCEAALAHVIGNKVEAAYRRGDLFEKRRALMGAWANFVETLPGATIVPLARQIR